MKTISNIIVLLILYNHVSAQNYNLENSKYNCTVSLTSKSILMKGEIYSVNDSAIILKYKKTKKLFLKGRWILDTIFVTQIDRIVIEKKSGFVNKVILYGLIGTASCAVAASGQYIDAGFLSSNSTQFSEYPVETVSLQVPVNTAVDISVFGDGIFGTIVGVISGNEKSVFPINGKIENYVKWRSQIVSYSIMK